MQLQYNYKNTTIAQFKPDVNEGFLFPLYAYIRRTKFSQFWKTIFFKCREAFTMTKKPWLHQVCGKCYTYSTVTYGVGHGVGHHPQATVRTFFTLHHEHQAFVEKVKSIRLEKGEYTISYDVKGLFTSIPMDLARSHRFT